MHSFFVPPAKFDVIVVTGQDSVRFLQGQLTCDVAAVEDAGFCYGAACNNKGRVFAAFTLIRWESSYYLCMTEGLGAVFLSALKKYLPFYKCTAHVSEQSLYALSGECVQKVAACSASSSAEAKVMAIPGGWLCLLDSNTSRALMLTSQSSLEVPNLMHPVREGTLEEWEAVSMLAGHYPFRASDAEHFTPQELHFDRNGYVSFSKGCYTGQEIVARMHYRGKLKKQLYLLTVDTLDASANERHSVAFHKADGTVIGHSLVSRILGEKALALAPLPIELADTATTLFTGAGLPVQYVPFP